jgi:hypothetical protein
MTSTVPLSSWIVTARGPPPAPPLLLPRLARLDLLPGGRAASMVSWSAPLLWIVYRLAATVPWVRSVATGMGGWEA